MNNKKKKITILIVAILAILIVVIGLTYAFFQATKNGGSNVIKVAEQLELVLENENTLKLTDTMPMTDEYAMEHQEDYTFDLRNSSNDIYEYTITLEHLITDLPVSVLRYSLQKDEEEWTEADYLTNFSYTNTIGKTTQHFKLKLWVAKETGNEYQNKEYKGRINVTASISAGLAIKVDLEEQNGMIPIKWDGTKWVKADSTNKNNDWYDYENFKWANMALVKTESRETLQNAAPGTEVSVTDDNSGDIEAMFVYIPRYRYKLWNVEGQANDPRAIEIEFETKDTAKSEGNKNGQWLTHPAFTFDNKELNGIWVGKFETSADTSSACYTTPNTTNCNDTTINPKIKPNVDSWKYIHEFNSLTNSQKFKNYGLASTSVDSHTMKNMEWGAVAYLSHSKYGKYGNPAYEGTNQEIYKNDSTMTGCSAGSPTASSSTTCAFKYDVEDEGKGTGASTTGTIYGIYDMNGGASEFVMAYALTSPSTIPEEKYYDVYAYGTNEFDYTRGKLGDATKEILYWYNLAEGSFEFPTSDLRKIGYADYAPFNNLMRNNDGIFGFCAVPFVSGGFHTVLLCL